MVITVSKVKTFEPEFNGNKELPATDRIVVKYKNPTVAMRERLIARPEVKSHADTDGKLDGVDIVMGEINKATALREMLVSISGCAYADESGTEHAISNAKELMEAPSEFNELTDEIVKKFEEELNKKVPEKNSR